MQCVQFCQLAQLVQIGQLSQIGQMDKLGLLVQIGQIGQMDQLILSVQIGYFDAWNSGQVDFWAWRGLSPSSFDRRTLARYQWPTGLAHFSPSSVANGLGAL